MELKDEIVISAPRDVVYQALNDPEVLRECIPGCEELVKHSDTELEAKVAENWDLYLRATAEVENARRRAERELAQALRFGPERLLRELMPALDSLALALSEHASEDDPARAGLEMIQRQFLQALDAVDVERLDPVGQPFDPELHEAMTMQETADAEPDTVLTVVQQGYRLQDRLVRPARVIVAKAPEA